MRSTRHKEPDRPTQKQSELIKSWKLPVPATKDEASRLIRFVLGDGGASNPDVGEYIRHLREKAAIHGCLVHVRSRRRSYTGIVVRLRVRVPKERVVIAQMCSDAIPPVYAAVVRDDKGHEYDEPLSSLTLIESASTVQRQRLLFE